MELLLRQNTFDIHKPPGGGLFDREYPLLLFFSRRLPAAKLPELCFQYRSRYRHDLVSEKLNYFNTSVFSLCKMCTVLTVYKLNMEIKQNFILCYILFQVKSYRRSLFFQSVYQIPYIYN